MKREDGLAERSVRAFCSVLLCLVTALLMVSNAWAQPASKRIDQDWAQGDQRLPLTAHLRYFKELPGQSLDWRQALASDKWQAAEPQDMAAFRPLQHKTTMWMQVEVENTSTAIQTRWVVIDYWAMMDAQLFVLDAGQNSLLSHQKSGQSLAPQDRALNTEKSAFAVSLLPGQRVRLLLRVSDLYWSHMVVDAWDSAAFDHAEAARKLRFAVVCGAVLALFAVLLLQRSRALMVVGIWMVFSLLLELGYVGFAAEYLVPARVMTPFMMLLLVAVLANSASSFVTMYFMGLNKHRFWPRWNWGLLAVSVTLTLLVLGTPSNLTRQGLSLLNIVQILSNLSMLAWARVKGNPLRQWMALVMVINFSLAIARIVVRQFYVDPQTFDLLMNSVMTIKGSLVLTVIALVALQRRRYQDEVQERLRVAEQQQRESLQSAVEQRTTELHRALIEANEASRAKTDFLARISHDLRSPLTSITGYAQLLQRVSGRTGQVANTIRRSADHMLVMVNDLIEYARGSNGERPEPLPVYIHSLLDGLVREGTALARRRNNRFIFNMQAELPPVLVLDGKRLRQVLTNLLDNAAKFTHNGEVELSVVAKPLQADGGRSEWLELVFSVRDTGHGIAQADQPRLFEPFYRTAQAEGVQGVGLGLSIVKTWVERLGGTISLVSEPGLGSTFMVRLPVEVGAEENMAPEQWQDDVGYLPALDGGGRLIWVVEDNADIRELLAEELHACAFEVMVASNGAEFLEQMQVGGAQVPSLVLTDYLMPGADGAAVLHGVRQKWSGVPVVLLSATQRTMHATSQDAGEGFDAHLMKPVNLTELRMTLARVLGLQMGSDGLITIPGGLEELPRAQVEGQATMSKPLLELRPPAEELRQVRQWVDMGAWSDLTEWVETLPKRYSACPDFTQRMEKLLAEARFDDIRALCAEEGKL